MIEKCREWRQLLLAFILSMWVMRVINVVNKNEAGVVLFYVLILAGFIALIAVRLYEKRLERRREK